MANGTSAGFGRVIFNAVARPPAPDPDNVDKPTSVPPSVAVAVLATVFLANGETPDVPSRSKVSPPEELSDTCSWINPLPLMNLTLIAGMVSVNILINEDYTISTDYC